MMKRMLFCIALTSMSAKASPLDSIRSLIGGKITPKEAYPEVVYISDGGGRCSATIVGPQVILTAAHCVNDSGEIRPAGFRPLMVNVEDQEFDALCKQAPLYRDNIQDHDMALCKIDRVLPGPYATISSVGPELGEEVIVMGYGCIGVDSAGRARGGNDGLLRAGVAPVTDLPSTGYHWYETVGRSALCFGDSGGPSFLKFEPGAPHMIVGVNSRGDMHSSSLMTALWTTASRKFFRSFTKETRTKICGVNKSC